MISDETSAVSVTDSSFEFLSAPPLWIVILLIVPAIVAFALLIYRRETLSPRVRGTLALIRIIAIVSVVLILFQPVDQSQVFSVSRSIVALLIDESASMDRKEEYPDELKEKLSQAAGLGAEELVEQITRADLVQRVLGKGERSILKMLEEKVEVRCFAFDRSYRPIVDPGEAKAGGEATAIGDAILGAINELRHRNLSGVIVLTDGQNNRGKDPIEVARLASGEGVQIHPVGVGNPATPQNIAILDVTAPDVALVSDQVAVEVSVVAQGYEGEPAEIVISDATGGGTLAQQSFALSGGGRQQIETLFFKPEREGEYRLEIAVPVKPGEQFVDDNKIVHHLRVDPEVIRVLYVEDRPRREYIFLKGILLRAENFKAQCLLTSAAADFPQEATKGQPSLIRFPPTRKDLFDYDVILLGDIAPDEIDSNGSRGTTENLLREILEFVEFGGGLVMISGQLHSPRDYRDSPIADALPVDIGSSEETESEKDDREAFRPHMPDPSAPHPMIRLEAELKRNRDLLEDPEVGLAPMRWYAAVARARQGAEIILNHPTNGNQFGPHVLMATTRVLRGRSVFIGFDETWLWRKPYEDRYTERFWKNVIRYAAIGKLHSQDRRFDLRTDKERYNVGESIQITVRVFDEDFHPSREESQIVRVQRGERAPEEVLAHRRESGLFERTLRADLPGTYRLWIEDPSQADQRLSQRVVEVQIPRLEILNPTLDKARLSQIAEISAGTFYGLHEMARLVEDIQGQSRRVPYRTEQKELWDRGWVVLLLVGLLSAEWLIRKYMNLL